MDEFFDDGGASAPPVTLERLRAAGSELVEAELAVDNLEQALAAAKKQLHHMRTSVIPDMMAEVGIDEFKLADGHKISVSDFVSGSLPKEPVARQKAIDWLVQHDGGSLLKTDVICRFGRSEHNIAGDLAESLRLAGHTPEVETGVHPSTLQAYGRERLKSGEEFDAEVLGLFVGRSAKVKLAKR